MLYLIQNITKNHEIKMSHTTNNNYSNNYSNINYSSFNNNKPKAYKPKKNFMIYPSEKFILRNTINNNNGYLYHKEKKTIEPKLDFNSKSPIFDITSLRSSREEIEEKLNQIENDYGKTLKKLKTGGKESIIISRDDDKFERKNVESRPFRKANLIRFSQTSVSPTLNSSDTTIDKLKDELILLGWDKKADPLRIVIMPDDKATSLDNRRLLALRLASTNDQEKPFKIEIFGHTEIADNATYCSIASGFKCLPNGVLLRNLCKDHCKELGIISGSYGELVKMRMYQSGESAKDCYGFDSTQIINTNDRKIKYYETVEQSNLFSKKT